MGKKILVITTSAATYGDSEDPTGLWLEELAAPYYIFKENGHEVTVASIKGGQIPLDPASLGKDALTPHCVQFQGDEAASALLKDSPALSSVSWKDYDALFIPGGHGTCFDLPKDQTFLDAVGAAFGAGKIVSSVCHGPGGLVNVVGPDGEPIVKGKKVTGFSDVEEDMVGKSKIVPFLLEDELKAKGGIYESGEPWQPFALRDGNLITGQNPASSAAVAQLVVEALA